jgi:hypothetical protein
MTTQINKIKIAKSSICLMRLLNVTFIWIVLNQPAVYKIYNRGR